MNSIKLSIVIPVLNEESSIDRSYSRLKEKLKKLQKLNLICDYEVIYIENNSKDMSWNKLITIGKYDQLVTVLQTATSGIGLALKKGLTRAKGDYVYFTAVDHPFNFEDLKRFLMLIDKYDLVFASKNNPKSIYQAAFNRKFASQFLSGTVKLLFNLPLTDTQGTFLISQTALIKILPHCNSSGPFFQTQLAINANKLGLRIGEVPITYRSVHNSSSFSLFRDGSHYFYEVIRARIKLPTWRNLSYLKS